MAWLHRLSTSVTAQSAARLRSTCKLLREVVDATWEPDPPVPPHRRRVPLTYEQVEAQLPPAQPRPPGTKLDRWEWASSEDEAQEIYHRYERPYQNGCNPYWLEVLGPALTRLTANQAVNMLQGKPLMGFADAPGRMVLWDLDKHSTAEQRLNALEEMRFENLDVQWPPQAPTGRAPGDGSDPGCESEESEEAWVAGGGRGECGWRDREHILAGTARRPMEWCRRWAESYSSRKVGSFPRPTAEDAPLAKQSHQFWVSTEYSRLLATTDSSCREATEEEVQQFVASDSPDDGDRFDVYLCYPDGSGPVTLYVFLGPVEPRLTGRPKVGACC